MDYKAARAGRTKVLKSLSERTMASLRGLFRGKTPRRISCAAEHQTGFHLDRLAVLAVGLELPLAECVGNHFRLIGKRAEEVNVFYLALFIDNDTDRNRIEAMLAENGVNAGKHIFIL